MAFMSSFWVCIRADWLLLQPEVEGGSCSELVDSRLYASEPLGGERLWELELWRTICSSTWEKQKIHLIEMYVFLLQLPLVALRGLQHHARVFAVGRAVGAACGLTPVSLSLHPALALPFA